MRIKQQYKFAGLLLFLFMFIGIASAATTMNVPVTSTSYTTITFNCTTTTTECDNCLNATIMYNATGGVADTTLGAILNGSAADIDFTGALNIESLTDATTYNFTCAMWNETGLQVTSAAVSSVTIDNTLPIISVSRNGLSYIDYMTSVSMSCSATDATSGVSTTTRTLTKPSGTTITTSSSPHTFSGGDLNELGLYTFTCLAIDDASNSNSDIVTFKVQTEEDDVTTTSKDTKGTKNISNTLLFLLIFGTAAITIIIIILASAYNDRK